MRVGAIRIGRKAEPRDPPDVARAVTLSNGAQRPLRGYPYGAGSPFATTA